MIAGGRARSCSPGRDVDSWRPSSRLRLLGGALPDPGIDEIALPGRRPHPTAVGEGSQSVELRYPMTIR